MVTIPRKMGGLWHCHSHIKQDIDLRKKKKKKTTRAGFGLHDVLVWHEILTILLGRDGSGPLHTVLHPSMGLMGLAAEDGGY